MQRVFWQFGSFPHLPRPLGREVASAQARDIRPQQTHHVPNNLDRPVLFAELVRRLKEEPDHAVLRIVRDVKDGEW